MLDRIDHIAIAVHRADDLVPYFVETLGLAITHDEVIHASGVRLVYVDAGNTFIQIAEPVGAGAIATFLADRGPGLHHICFAVRDIAETIRAIGGQSTVAVAMGGRGQRTCFLADTPEGLIVELTETAPIPALEATMDRIAR